MDKLLLPLARKLTGFIPAGWMTAAGLIAMAGIATVQALGYLTAEQADAWLALAIGVFGVGVYRRRDGDAPEGEK